MIFTVTLTLTIIFDTDYYLCFIEDWRVAGYRWFQNGTKWIPKRNPVIKKVYFIAVTPSGHNKLFKQNVIFNTQEDIEVILIIHYIGDQSVACDFPHGNAKSSQNYHRTLPSVLKRLSSEHDKPGTVYSNAVANSSICSTQHQPSVIPRVI